MSAQTYIKFQWEGSDNPNDTSGVATLTSPYDKVIIGMNDFNQALKLNAMIENACNQSKDDALRKAQARITDTITKLIYD